MMWNALTQSIRLLPPPHPLDQPLDMLDRRVRRDAMAEIEDVRAAAHRGKDRVDALVERLPAGDEAERIEIALQRRRRRNELARQRHRRHPVDRDGIDAGSFAHSVRAARRRRAESR